MSAFNQTFRSRIYVRYLPGVVSSPKGIDRIVVGDMSALAFAWKTFALSFMAVLVIILIRGDVVMDVNGEGSISPVADAGVDQRLIGPVHVQFDGTASSDDLEVVDYLWEFTYNGSTEQMVGQRPEFFIAHHGVYEVTLTVTDENAATDNDIVNITVITVPGIIERVTIIGRNNWNDIAWSSPVHDGGSPVVGSIVYRGTTESNMEPTYTDNWVKGWTWDPLAENGFTYYYAVAAINEVGMGPLSHVANGTPIAVPDSPQNLTLEVVDGAIHLAWDPPLWSYGRVNLTGYNVHKGTDPEWLYEAFDVGLNTSYVDEDVEDGVTYYYVVSANSALGGSTVTELMNVTIGDPPVEDGNPETWEVILGFVLIAGMIGGIAYLFHWERQIGKKIDKAEKDKKAED